VRLFFACTPDDFAIAQPEREPVEAAERQHYCRFPAFDRVGEFTEIKLTIGIMYTNLFDTDHILRFT
jgi:hypothetical protein